MQIMKPRGSHPSPRFTTTLILRGLRSKWNWNSEYIVDPREIRSRGWAVALGGDGDGVGWDERDAEGERGETLRESTGNKEEGRKEAG